MEKHDGRTRTSGQLEIIVEMKAIENLNSSQRLEVYNGTLQAGGATTSIAKTGDKYQVIIDVQQFAPEEIVVKTDDKYITIEGKHEEKKDEHGYISRHFVRRYALPQGYDIGHVRPSLSSDGVLTITAPKLALPAPGERIVPINRSNGPAIKA